MSKDCDIVKDLIIGYKENSLRENSISFVEEHIKSCIECKNYLKMVEDDIEEENNKIENDKNIDFFKSINKVINKNKKFVKVLSILLMIVIIFNIVVFINYKVFMNEVGMEIFLEEDVTTEEPVVDAETTAETVEVNPADGTETPVEGEATVEDAVPADTTEDITNEEGSETNTVE